jgi:small nuclear ribonucleoprotein (snRNP)-like protein
MDDEPPPRPAPAGAAGGGGDEEEEEERRRGGIRIIGGGGRRWVPGTEAARGGRGGCEDEGAADRLPPEEEDPRERERERERERGCADKETVRRVLLGARVVCRLSDGRAVSGRLACVDRLYVSASLVPLRCVALRCCGPYKQPISSLLTLFGPAMLLCSFVRLRRFSIGSVADFLRPVRISRSSNLVLADCVEERTVRAGDYRPGPGPGAAAGAGAEGGGGGNGGTAGSGAEGDGRGPSRAVRRRLAQAMVPGSELVYVGIDRAAYEARAAAASAAAAGP